MEHLAFVAMGAPVRFLGKEMTPGTVPRLMCHRPCRAVAVLIAAAFGMALAACSPGGQAQSTMPGADEAGLPDSSSGVDGGGPTSCPSSPCADGQICSDGACVALPAHCPCPLESYCDLATNSCRAGCTEDGNCGKGRFCNKTARQCEVGCRFTMETLPADGHAVWASGPQDIYVVGGGIFHSTGDGTWRQQSAVSGLRAIWGSSATDLYAVGDDGAILHSNGSGTWTEQFKPIYRVYESIWGSGPNDIYAVGHLENDSMVIVHSSGDGKWTDQTPPTSGNLYSISGTGPNDIYVAGTTSRWGSWGAHFGKAIVFHSSGDGKWTEVKSNQSTGSTSNAVRGIWAGGGEVFAVSGEETANWHFRSGAWAPLPFEGAFVWGSSRSDVNVLDGARLRHYDGVGWTESSLPVYGVGAVSFSGCELFVVRGSSGTGGVLHRQ